MGKGFEASLPATVISTSPDGDPRDPRPIPPPPDSLPSPPSRQELGRYRILGLLGAGGMGNVYRALDTELDDIVALKMLRRDLADQGAVVERFRREVKLARRVTHRNIARVFDIGEADGEKFLTMELIEGPSLAEVLASRGFTREPGKDGIAEAVELASTICDALGAAHAAGVVHLDLKPGNILLERGGRVVLTDFGIARALAEAHVSDGPHGTPGYMAPEQVAGFTGVDARADLHALGALLFELLTGKAPWADAAPHSFVSTRRGAPSPDPRAARPDVPPALAAIVTRALAFSPDDRFASAAAFSQALAALAAPPSSRVRVDVKRAPTPEREVPASSSLRPTRGHQKAVAVLPFRNRGAPEDEYLAEELTDDLIDALSTTPGIRVSSRGVVARYRTATVDPREVGRALGVKVVAEGSVRRGGGRVRVSARLISVDEGFQLWAKRFDRPEEEILAVNDEAARAIAAALTVDFVRPSRGAPTGAGAVDLYIRARNRYRRFWPEHVEQAVVLFEEAVTLAPDDPAILGGLALARTRLSYFAADAIPGAIAAGRRAVAAGALAGEPHLALGSALLNAGRPIEGILELGQALALSPVLPEAHAALGRMLVECGDLESGTRRLRAALELDAEAPLALGALLRVHAFAGDWARARELVERTRATDGELGYILLRARLAAWQRDPAAASSLVEPVRKLRGLGPHSLLPEAMVHIVAGARGPADIPDLSALPPYANASVRAQGYIWQAQAEACAFVRDRARTLTALEQASACELVDRMWIEQCPLFEDLRGDARFAAVAAAVAARCTAALAAYHERIGAR